MTEKDLIELYNRNRMQLIIAQLAPTFLLITTAVAVPAIRAAGIYTALAVFGILLASGILGALVEFNAANDAQAVARDIQEQNFSSALSKAIVKTAPLLHIAKYLTPAIFVGIFLALSLALFG